MKIEENDILGQQEAEAKRLGLKLDEPEEEDETTDVKVVPEEKQEKKIEQEKSEPEKKDEEKSEDEEEDKNQPKRPPKGSLQQEAFKQRENKRLENIVNERLTAALNPVMEMLKELKEAKTPEAKQDAAENIDDELSKLAENEKIPVEQFKKITSLITKQVEAGLAPRLKQMDEFAPLIEKQQADEQTRQVEEIFNTEWNNQAEPILTENYKNANATQMKEARTLLSQLAISADYGDTRGNKDGVPEHPAYPVDYIIYKEAEKFDTILNSPRKKSFENSSNISDNDSGEPTKLEELYGDKEITNTADAVALQKKLDKVIGGEKTILKRGGQDVDMTE